MGNSRTSRYADGKTIHDLNHVSVAWLRRLVQQSDFQLVEPGRSARARGRRVPPRRLERLRAALVRAPPPVPVSPRRGAGEVQRMLLDPDVAPRLRRLARDRGHDEGDVASVWAQMRVKTRAGSTAGLLEAEAS